MKYFAINLTALLCILIIASKPARGTSRDENCPLPISCNGCGVDWKYPVIKEDQEYISSNECKVTLSWEWPYDSTTTDANPRMTFLCFYDNLLECNAGEEDACASCESITIYRVNPNKNPFINFTDTCGNKDNFRIAENCLPSTQTVVTTKIPTFTTTTAQNATELPETTAQALNGTEVTTEEPHISTNSHNVTTQQPIVTTDLQNGTTDEPIGTTDSRNETTGNPVTATPTGEPVNTTHDQTTEIPVVTTSAQNGTTEVPENTTDISNVTTEAPFVTTFDQTSAEPLNTTDNAIATTENETTEKPAATTVASNSTNPQMTTENPGNFCPPHFACNECPDAWDMPKIYENSVLVEEGFCDVHLSWNTNLTSDNGDPRMSFTCYYGETGEYCTERADLICASCSSLTLHNISAALNPYVSYTDSCGYSNQLIIATECFTPPEGTTVAPDRCPDALGCSGCDSETWESPRLNVTTGPKVNGSCDVYINWDWDYTPLNDYPNARYTFQCIYENGEFCDGDHFQAACGSCEEVVFESLSEEDNPYINYSNTCGDLYRLNVPNCQS